MRAEKGHRICPLPSMTTQTEKAKSPRLYGFHFGTAARAPISWLFRAGLANGRTSLVTLPAVAEPYEQLWCRCPDSNAARRTNPASLDVSSEMKSFKLDDTG